MEQGGVEGQMSQRKYLVAVAAVAGVVRVCAATALCAQAACAALRALQTQRAAVHAAGHRHGSSSGARTGCHASGSGPCASLRGRACTPLRWPLTFSRHGAGQQQQRQGQRLRCAVAWPAPLNGAAASARACHVNGQAFGCGDGLRRRQGRARGSIQARSFYQRLQSLRAEAIRACTRRSEGEGLPAQVQAVGMGARRGCGAVLTGKSGGRTFPRPTKLLTRPRPLPCREKAQGAAQAQALQAWLVLSLVPVVGQ